jgi:predicted transposase YbfD/YdcC
MVWMQSMSSLSTDKLVALDGKTLRGTKQSGTGKRQAEQTALELVTAWLSENELVLAQLAVPQGSNEISVIPDLLELLDLEGATVTLDAMGCHKDITDTIIKQGGQYLLSLKRNHKLLFQAVADLFEDTLNSATTLDKAGSFDVAHGRQEERTCYVLPVAPHAERFKLADCELTPWTHLQTFIMVEATTLRQGEVSTHRRFFLSSLSCSVAEALTKVRQHWSIENQQHYPLDVLFHEDASRNRKGFLAQNVAALRRLSLNLLNLDTSTKLSKRRKRLKALLDDDYLLSLLGIQLSH